MFALAADGQLDELLADAGFVERRVEPVSLGRSYDSVEDWIAETLDMSVAFSGVWEPLSPAQRTGIIEEISRRAEPFTAADGSLSLPGSSLAAAAL